MFAFKYLYLVLILPMLTGIPQQEDKYLAQRKEMVSKQIISRGIRNPLTLKAMQKVPRHMFVKPEYRSRAYEDNPLPIGYDQTISQPFIVAYMTELAKPAKWKKVLEIGTGSGYQAAVLAEIVDTVFTIEIIPQLAREAATRLRVLQFQNIITKTGDVVGGRLPSVCMLQAATSQLWISWRRMEGIMPIGAPSSAQQIVLAVKKERQD
ncbi:MAG: protein-L-isoaspartate O-methyltransferase [Bacteroidales bacterium]